MERLRTTLSMLARLIVPGIAAILVLEAARRWS